MLLKRPLAENELILKVVKLRVDDLNSRVVVLGTTT